MVSMFFGKKGKCQKFIISRLDKPFSITSVKSIVNQYCYSTNNCQLVPEI